MSAEENLVRVAIMRILEDEKSYKTSLNYAVNYCKAAIKMNGEDLRVQCLYILNNISHWRGEGSKEVRKILKDFTAKKGR
jgi:hypothetical protein